MTFKSMIRIAAIALATGAPGAAYGQSATANPPATPPAFDVSNMFKPIPANDVPGAIPLRPPLRKSAPEQWEQMTFGGSSNRSIRNVVNPTLTPVLPDPAKATGVAVIVAPGGGFRGLAIDHEGFQVARWLADRGIAAFVLKYRLVPTPRDATTYMQSVMAEIGKRPPEEVFRDPTPEALEDAQAAIRLVRQRSAEWNIAPGKLGFVGFLPEPSQRWARASPPTLPRGPISSPRSIRQWPRGRFLQTLRRCFWRFRSTISCLQQESRLA